MVIINRNGFATVISVSLMLVALLYLTASISHFPAMMQEGNSWMAQAAGVQEQSDAAAYGARSLAQSYGMGASLQGNRATFGISIAQLPAYGQAMDGWGSFLDFLAASGRAGMGANASEAINTSEAALPKISIYPQGMSIAALQSGSVRSINVTPGAGGVLGYNITAKVIGSPEFNYSQVTWAACGADALLFSLTAEDYLSGDRAQTPDGACVGRGAANSIGITSLGNAIATVRVAGNGSLAYEYAQGSNIYLTVAAEFDSPPSDAELGQSAVTATSGSVGKNGRVLIG